MVDTLQVEKLEATDCCCSASIHGLEFHINKEISGMVHKSHNVFVKTHFGSYAQFMKQPLRESKASPAAWPTCAGSGMSGRLLLQPQRLFCLVLR
jgi:hypothetical protein